MTAPIDTSHLQALAVNKATQYEYSNPGPRFLEFFDCPHVSDVNPMRIHIEQPEFTSLCPLTGQPDFAVIIIDYSPHLRCVESKSLKLYLMAFRNQGEFHEACVKRIHDDLLAVLDPLWLRVEGRFTPRGGIPFWPTIETFRG